MRILYVLTALGMGGAERQVVALAERMKKRGHTVALLILSSSAAEEWTTGLPVFHLEMRRTVASVMSGLVKGRRLVREFRPELVHSHTFHANLIARLLRIIAPVPTVFSTIHNVYEGGWKRMLAYRLTDGLSDRTIAVGEAVARRYIDLKAVSERKCSVVCNGFDTGEFAPSMERRARTRAEMAAHGEFVWLAAGRIVPAKDFTGLLWAFARVWAGRRDARLWVAGEATGAEYAKVTRLAKSLGLSNVVSWLGLRRDMPALLDAADGFVLSSAWEGMPLALGEAMAMEKPVVATDVGAVRELVGNAGLIIPSNVPDALAIAMLDVMHRPQDARSALGRAARERIQTSFSMDAKADEWEALYRAAASEM